MKIYVAFLTLPLFLFTTGGRKNLLLISVELFFTHIQVPITQHFVSSQAELNAVLPFEWRFESYMLYLICFIALHYILYNRLGKN